MKPLIFLSIGLVAGAAYGPTTPEPTTSKQIKDPALRAELVKRMKAEQDVRFEFIRLNPRNKPLTAEDRQKPEFQAVFKKMETVDKDNLAWFKGVVDSSGWPGKSRAAPDGVPR